MIDCGDLVCFKQRWYLNPYNKTQREFQGNRLFTPEQTFMLLSFFMCNDGEHLFSLYCIASKQTLSVMFIDLTKSKELKDYFYKLEETF
jgi:hypothetical protein